MNEEEEAEEVKTEAEKPVEVKPVEVKTEAVKPVEVKPVEVKPVEVKPVEVKPAEVKPAEVKPAEVKPVEVKTVEVKPVEVKPVEVKTVEVKPVEVKTVEVKPVEVKTEVPRPQRLRRRSSAQEEASADAHKGVAPSRGEFVGGVSRTKCLKCGAFCRSHAHHLSHLATAHPDLLDGAPAGRLGLVFLYQASGKLFHCNICFYTHRDFTQVWQHILRSHCGDTDQHLNLDQDQHKDQNRDKKQEKETNPELNQDLGPKTVEMKPDAEKQEQTPAETQRGDEERGDEERGDEERGDEERGDEEKGDKEKMDEERGDEKRREEERGEEERGEEGHKNREQDRGDKDRGDEEKRDEERGDKERTEEGHKNRDEERGDENRGDDEKLNKKKRDEERTEEGNKNKELERGDEEKGDKDRGEEDRGDSKHEEQMETDDRMMPTLKRKSPSPDGPDTSPSPDASSCLPPASSPSPDASLALLRCHSGLYRCSLCDWSHKLRAVAVNHVVRKHDSPRHLYDVVTPPKDVQSEPPAEPVSAPVEEEEEVTAEKMMQELEATKILRFYSNRVECELCGWKAKVKRGTRGFALNHLERSHDLPRTYQCSVCAQTFFMSYQLKEHIRFTHKPGRFRCLFCAFRSDYLGGFRRHIAKCNYRDEEQDDETQELYRTGPEPDQEPEERIHRPRRRTSRRIVEEDETDEDEED